MSIPINFLEDKVNGRVWIEFMFNFSNISDRYTMKRLKPKVFGDFWPDSVCLKFIAANCLIHRF